MRFSMLYSGEQILSFKSCLIFYAGNSLSMRNKVCKEWADLHPVPFKCRGARWLSGRVSDSGARGPRGSRPTAAMLCP